MVLTPSEGAASYEDAVRQLGLEAYQLREAVGAGNLERQRTVSGHCAKSAGGYYAWNGTLTRLSTVLTESAWFRVDPFSAPLLINSTKQLALTVSSGDQYTGIRGLNDPRTKNAKGDLTDQLLSQNRELIQRTERLFELPRMNQRSAFLATIEDYQFWMMLVYFDPKKREIRYEVSFPLGSDENGYTNRWRPRLIAPPYQLAEDIPDEGDFGDGTDDIDVPVDPR